MSRDPAVARLVSALVGTWSGHGEGGYPTIERFLYRELLVITERDDHPALHYEQRAWRQTGDGEVVSHWETGLLRISSEGTLTMFNAQSGRAEAMEGRWTGDEDTWTLHLESRDFAGDQRMQRSSRIFTVGADSLRYEMSMHTSASPQLGPHLQATLTRRP